MDFTEQFIMLGQILGSMGLGGVIGLERELANRPAGFRTHMIVAGASAVIVRLGEPILGFYAETSLGDFVEADPFRVIGAIVTGIAFLGAGTIIQRESKMKVEGLTTAASLLFSGAIGIASAVDLWWFAIGLTVVTVFLLQVLIRFESWLDGRRERLNPSDKA